MENTATREELKAILDEWIPKYIRQVVELRSGNKLTAERYNELMNLLITQGDDTIELAQVVKQYVELLVEEMSTEFEVTTETVTNLANTAITTANGAVDAVTEYKTKIDNDIKAFKEAVNQATDTANTNASTALTTANELVLAMEGYRVDLSTQVEETFINMRLMLSDQITNEVGTQMQGIQEALTTDITNTINALSTEVMTIANTAEQAVNSAVQDIEAYKTGMDVRLDEALQEVEDSLSAAGEVIKDASAIYTAIDELNSLVNGYENRIKALEDATDGMDDKYSPKEHSHSGYSSVGHHHDASEIANLPQAVLPEDLPDWVRQPTKPTYTAAEVGLGNVPNVDTNDQTPTFSVATSRTNIVSGEKLSVILGKIMKFFADLKTVAFSGSYADLSDKPTSLPASDVYTWAKASAKPSYTWNEITSKPTSFTPTSHNQGANTVTSGTFAGKVNANATAMATTTTAQVRDIVIKDSVTEGATASEAEGTIVFSKS